MRFERGLLNSQQLFIVDLQGPSNDVIHDFLELLHLLLSNDYLRCAVYFSKFF